MALTAGLGALASKVIGELQALSKEDQAAGTPGMEILLTNVMEHIIANGVIDTNVSVVSVSGVMAGGAASGPGAGTGVGGIS